MSHANQNNHLRTERGQSVLEFALALPVFLLAIGGTLQISGYFYQKLALDEAARIGVRTAVTTPDQNSVTLQAAVEKAVISNLQKAGVSITVGQIKLVLPGSDETTKKEPVTLTLEKQVKIFGFPTAYAKATGFRNWEGAPDAVDSVDSKKPPEGGAG